MRFESTFALRSKWFCRLEYADWNEAKLPRESGCSLEPLAGAFRGTFGALIPARDTPQEGAPDDTRVWSGLDRVQDVSI